MIFVSLARSSNVKNVTDIDSGRVVVKGNYNAVNLYPDKDLKTVLGQLQRKIESLEGRMDALEKTKQGISRLLFQFSLSANTYLRWVALCILTFLMRNLFAGNRLGGFTVAEVRQKRGKIYGECMGKIVILMLDDLRKVDILKFLWIAN